MALRRLLGVLTVRMNADSAELRKDFKKAESASKQFSRNVTNELKAVGTTLGVVGAAAGAALGLMVRRSLEVNDQLGKTAQKLGVTTEALAGLRFAAEQTGVASNQLDLGIQRMTRRIAEAAQGTGEAKNALIELGLNAQSLAAQSIDEQFREVAAAMENVTNQSDRIRLGFKLFDSEGVALINTLKEGRAGLDAFAQEAQDLGIALNAVEVAKIEAANDAINKAKRAFEGVGNAVTVALAPAITLAAEKFTDFAKNVNRNRNSIIDAVEDIARFFVRLGNTVKGVEFVFRSVALVAQSALAAVPIFVLEIVSVVADAIDEVLSASQSALAKLANAPGVIGEAAANAATNIGEIRIGLNNIGTAAETTSARFIAGLEQQKEGLVQVGREISTNAARLNGFFDEIRNAPEIEIAEGLALPEIDGTGLNNVGPDPFKLTQEMKAAQAEITSFQIEQERLRASEIAILEQELFEAQKLSAQELDAEKRRLAADFALFEVEQEIQKQELLRAAKGDEPLSDEEKNDIRIAEAQRAADEITRIDERAASKQKQIDDNALKARQKFFANSLQLLQFFGVKSKGLQKALLAAQVVSTAKEAGVAIQGGIAKALNNPFPANLGYAAIVAAEGVKILSAISSIGGTGGGVNSSGGVTSTAPSDVVADVAADPGREVESEPRQTQVQIVFNGDVLDFDRLAQEQLIPAIQDAVNERDIVIVSTESRNGQDLVGATV